MRRLPIFLLVDISESMAGESLYKLEDGMAALVRTLRQDPHALETAWLSVIVFAGKARTLVPLTDLMSFQTPELPIGGGTALGAALSQLMDEIDTHVRTTTPDQKGDWRPFVFLLTDGHPTDNPSAAIAHWNENYRDRAHLVAVSIGGGADVRILRDLCDDVIEFDDTAPDAFARFVRWISMSIQSQSRAVSTSGDSGVSLAKTEPELLADVTTASAISPYSGVDDRWAVFVGRCGTSKLPYLVRYQRHLGRIETDDPMLARLLETRNYFLVNAVPVKQSYFDLSDDGGHHESVNSQDLIGQPRCPHCNNPYGMAQCACGGIHCVGGEGVQTCPWCGKTGNYGAAGEGEGFDVGRGRG